MQQLQSPNHGLRRRGGQPVKPHDVVNAQSLQLQHRAGQLAALNLGDGAVGQSLEVLLRAQPEAEAGPHTASTACMSALQRLKQALIDKEEKGTVYAVRRS